MTYGSVHDALDGYLQMGATTTRECIVFFCKAIMELYGEEFLRKPAYTDIEKLYARYDEKHGFPWMITSIDCTGWMRENCPVALTAQFCRGDHGEYPFILLEGISSQDLDLACVICHRRPPPLSPENFFGELFRRTPKTLLSPGSIRSTTPLATTRRHHHQSHHLSRTIYTPPPPPWSPSTADTTTLKPSSSPRQPSYHHHIIISAALLSAAQPHQRHHYGHRTIKGEFGSYAPSGVHRVAVTTEKWCSVGCVTALGRLAGCVTAPMGAFSFREAPRAAAARLRLGLAPAEGAFGFAYNRQRVLLVIKTTTMVCLDLGALAYRKTKGVRLVAVSATRVRLGGCLDSGLTAATTKGASVLIENTNRVRLVLSSATSVRFVLFSANRVLLVSVINRIRGFCFGLAAVGRYNAD
nr:hypothetical protein [Tanacetum cinerariifolium]